GYGSEFHKLRADGLDDRLAVFGRPALENIARGFGLRGHEIRDVSVIPKLFADFVAQGESEIWNIQISDKVTAPVIRQTIKRAHGNTCSFLTPLAAPLHHSVLIPGTLITFAHFWVSSLTSFPKP